MIKKCLLILGFILLGTPGVWADSSAISPGNPVGPAMFSASLESTELTGQVDKPTVVQIQLEPNSIPFGYFIVSLAEVVQGPVGPDADILTGYPELLITPRAAGNYQIMVRVNLIIKSSCGGAEAHTLLKQMVHLTVLPN